MHRKPDCTPKTEETTTTGYQHWDFKTQAAKQQTGQGVLQPGWKWTSDEEGDWWWTQILHHLPTRHTHFSGAPNSSWWPWSQCISKNICHPQKSFLLERNEGRHQKVLQNMCNMPTTQTRERKIWEENLQAITSTHGFYLHGLNRWIPPSDKLWTPLCSDSCLYAYRVYMVCTFEDKDSRRGRESIYGPHLQ